CRGCVHLPCRCIESQYGAASLRYVCSKDYNTVCGVGLQSCRASLGSLVPLAELLQPGGRVTPGDTAQPQLLAELLLIHAGQVILVGTRPAQRLEGELALRHAGLVGNV